MTITPKNWVNVLGGLTTPVRAEALIDMEQRLGAYADSVAAGGQILQSVAVTSWAGTSSTSFVDIPGCTINVPVGAWPVKFGFMIGSANCQALLGGGFLLVEDASTNRGTLGTVGQCASGVDFRPVSQVRILTGVAVGTHAYRVQAKTTDGAKALGVSIGDGTGINSPPMLFWAEHG